MTPTASAPPPSLNEIVREWGRIGCIGFGGPPAHIALFRELCVGRRGWLSDVQFERALGAVNLLPGPASTQLAIYCAWRLRGPRGALLGGASFILPGLVLILALSTLFLAGSPPRWVRGAGMGAGAAVAAVALWAGLGVAGPIFARARGRARARVALYGLVGGTAAATLGPGVVLALLGCGAIELVWRGDIRGGRRGGPPGAHDGPRGGLGAHAWLVGVARSCGAHLASLASTVADPGGTGAVAWTAFKVGALAFGGGFVIVPLMQADAVHTYHWMTNAQFSSAVALGQVTPGPVTQTVAAVGYSAGGLAAGLFAALVAFAPSFSFILIGAARFERLLVDERVLAFLAGAAPAAAGAIVGSAIPLAGAIVEWWQYPVLAAAAVALLAFRVGVVPTLLAAGVAGLAAGLLGAPLPG